MENQRAIGVSKLWVGLAIFWVAEGVSKADTVTIEPVADTCLWELNPDFNFGAQTDVPSGTLGQMGGRAKSRMLVKFDIGGALPAGAVIERASLRLSVVISPSGGANSIFELRRIAFDWGEGMKKGSEPGGATATAGDSTWNHRFHPATEWDDPGGDIGTDFASVASAGTLVRGVNNYEFSFEEVGLADLGSMVEDPSNNFGWAIISTLEGTAKTARRWATREHPNAAVRPQLEIEYSIPTPPEPEIRSVEVGDSLIKIRVVALAGIRYSLQRREEFEGADWMIVDSVAAEPDPREVEFVVSRGAERRLFFRVVATTGNG